MTACTDDSPPSLLHLRVRVPVGFDGPGSHHADRQDDRDEHPA
jgi:hypothetical protein